MDNIYKSFVILLVEDNPADARLVKESFEEYKVNTEIQHVKDGAEAMDYLYQKKKLENAILPDIIVLDVNLPKMSGMEFLEKIKNDDNLKCIPVIVLGTSSDQKEIERAYEKRANCYIIKPVDLDQFMNVIRSIEDFWLTIVKLPTKLDYE